MKYPYFSFRIFNCGFSLEWFLDIFHIVDKFKILPFLNPFLQIILAFHCCSKNRPNRLQMLEDFCFKTLQFQQKIPNNLVFFSNFDGPEVMWVPTKISATKKKQINRNTSKVYIRNIFEGMRISYKVS